MTVADGFGIVRQARPKPGDFGRYDDEWWCESEFGDSVLILSCKTAEQAAMEAAAYFNTLAVDGPFDSVTVFVEGQKHSQTTWDVQRHESWRPTERPDRIT